MAAETEIPNIPTLFQFLVRPKVFYLVDKEKLDRLPEKMRAYATFAPPELVEAIGPPLSQLRGQ
ncbi:MAG: hypothetical protein KDD69_17910, partial [Bdellovibrionales bacterium]|nr:hypothetical protein [Bdellovibrionales bacterium]